MNATDVYLLKTALGWLTGKMVALPIWALFTLSGYPFLPGPVLHGLAEILREVL